MALKLSQTELMDLHGKAQTAIARARKALVKSDQVVDKAVEATVTAGAAFAAGLAQGRYGAIEVVGVPADLLAGAGLHVLGFLGVAGKQSQHLHAAANGALASFAATMGRGVGVEWKRKTEARALGGGSPAGSLTAASGSTISDKELAALVHGA